MSVRCVNEALSGSCLRRSSIDTGGDKRGPLWDACWILFTPPIIRSTREMFRVSAAASVSRGVVGNIQPNLTLLRKVGLREFHMQKMCLISEGSFYFTALFASWMQIFLFFCTKNTRASFTSRTVWHKGNFCNEKHSFDPKPAKVDSLVSETLTFTQAVESLNNMEINIPQDQVSFCSIIFEFEIRGV